MTASARHEKSFVLTLQIKFEILLSLHCNSDNSYLYVNGTEAPKLKGIDKLNPYQCCLGSISKDFIINNFRITSTNHAFLKNAILADILCSFDVTLFYLM